MRGTAPSSHWRISAARAPTHQFASTKPLTKHTLHTYLNARHQTHVKFIITELNDEDFKCSKGYVNKLPNTICCSNYLCPRPPPYPASVINPPHPTPPPPPPHYPMPRLPPPPFSPSSRPEPSGPFKRYSLSTTPSVSVPCPPPTLVLSFTVPIVPFHPSSVLQTSVDPGLLIPSAFYTPPPSTNPHTTLYLAHTTSPTLTHWWFNTWGAQPHHPTVMDLCPSCTNPSICISQTLNQTHSAYLLGSCRWVYSAPDHRSSHFSTITI